MIRSENSTAAIAPPGHGGSVSPSVKWTEACQPQGHWKGDHIYKSGRNELPQQPRSSQPPI